MKNLILILSLLLPLVGFSQQGLYFIISTDSMYTIKYDTIISDVMSRNFLGKDYHRACLYSYNTGRSLQEPAFISRRRPTVEVNVKRVPNNNKTRKLSNVVLLGNIAAQEGPQDINFRIKQKSLDKVFKHAWLNHNSNARNREGKTTSKFTSDFRSREDLQDYLEASVANKETLKFWVIRGDKWGKIKSISLIVDTGEQIGTSGETSYAFFWKKTHGNPGTMHPINLETYSLNGKDTSIYIMAELAKAYQEEIGMNSTMSKGILAFIYNNPIILLCTVIGFFFLFGVANKWSIQKYSELVAEGKIEIPHDERIKIAEYAKEKKFRL